MNTHNGFLVGPDPAEQTTRVMEALRLPPDQRQKAFDALRREREASARAVAERMVAELKRP